MKKYLARARVHAPFEMPLLIFDVISCVRSLSRLATENDAHISYRVHRTSPMPLACIVSVLLPPAGCVSSIGTRHSAIDELRPRLFSFAYALRTSAGTAVV